MGVNDFKIMKLNVEANMLRIQQLLEQENIENKTIDDLWYRQNRENVELRQRLRMLRKDTVKLEKILSK